jgi:hypothetical protein
VVNVFGGCRFTVALPLSDGVALPLSDGVALPLSATRTSL